MVSRARVRVGMSDASIIWQYTCSLIVFYTQYVFNIGLFPFIFVLSVTVKRNFTSFLNLLKLGHQKLSQNKFLAFNSVYYNDLQSKLA